MLESMRLRNFTAFSAAEFQFARGLNVFVGENATGKTHVLKAAYSCAAVVAGGGNGAGPAKSHLEHAVAAKLMGVFRPDQLGGLARRPGRGRCEAACVFGGTRETLAFHFSAAERDKASIAEHPSVWTGSRPVYIPTRELLTLYPGFVSLYETTHLPFEETWRDTCILLGAPLAKGPRESRARKLLTPLERAMDGKIELDGSGRFYFKSAAGRMEMHLVAEGLRKLAMLARLVATGSLDEKGVLFWDEPEASLNPKLIRIVARSILDLAAQGVQVFFATHSLFLMRELDILLHEKFQDLPARFFGLHRANGRVRVEQGETIDDIGSIAALDEELAQSDSYLDSAK